MGTQLKKQQLQMLEAQFDKWQQDLVNLTKRSKLLYFKHTETSSLEITDPTLPQILTRLESREWHFARLPVDDQNGHAPQSESVMANYYYIRSKIPRNGAVTMARRTYAEIIIDVLKQQPSNQASPARLAQLTGWSLDKVNKVVHEANADASVEIHIGRGGTVQHRGTERVSSNGLYRDLASVIENYWGPRNLGLRNISVIDTSRGGTRGSGVWAHPDLVIAADPKRRSNASEARRLHAIEVETKQGFDLRSIYQAHAAGRGSNYYWVIGSKEPNVDPKDWDRILWTADDLGVGLVTYKTSGAYTTWTHHRDARFRIPDHDERENFLNLALGPRVRAEHSL